MEHSRLELCLALAQMGKHQLFSLLRNAKAGLVSSISKFK